VNNNQTPHHLQRIHTIHPTSIQTHLTTPSNPFDASDLSDGRFGVVYFVVPLFYRSIRKADELSDALESRGYHLKRRYYYYSQNPALRDYIAGGVFLGLAILILFPPV
jgi:hypothetical protein